LGGSRPRNGFDVKSVYKFFIYSSGIPSKLHSVFSAEMNICYITNSVIVSRRRQRPAALANLNRNLSDITAGVRIAHPSGALFEVV
jgi:hypothetical protein